jgi:hypothetical protein
MSELNECLKIIEKANERDVRIKCKASIKIIFALIDSVEECAPKPTRNKIFRRYKDLIKYG